MDGVIAEVTGLGDTENKMTCALILIRSSDSEYLPEAQVLGNVIGVVATFLVIWITTVKYRRNRRQLARTYAEYPRKAGRELGPNATQRNVMVIGGAGFLGYGRQ